MNTVMLQVTITIFEQGTDAAAIETDRNNKQVTLKNCALFSDCNSEINNTQLQSVTKIIHTHYIFMKKSLKSDRYAQRYPEFPIPLVQCCAKLCKAMPGSGGQK